MRYQSEIIRLNGKNINYYRTGGDKPAVVLNHGAGEDGTCWARMAELLKDEYDVIMPDARGHGESSPGDGDYSKEARSADLWGLFDRLGLQKPIIAGHSMGADTCLHFAAAYPDRVSGVILEDPPIIRPGEKFREGLRKIAVEDAGCMLSKGLKVMKILPGFLGLLVARLYSPNCANEDYFPWVNARKKVSFDFINAVRNLPFDLADPFNAVRKIPVPILMFIGERRKMAIVSWKTAQKLADLNPGMRVVHLAGARHDIRRSRFDGFFPEMQKFLHSIQLTGSSVSVGSFPAV